MLKLNKWSLPLVIFAGLLVNLIMYWKPGAGMHQSKLDIIEKQPIALTQMIIGGTIGFVLAMGTGFGGGKIARAKRFRNGAVRTLLQAVACIIPVAAGYLAIEGYRASPIAWSEHTLVILQTILPLNSSLYSSYLFGSLLDEITATIKRGVGLKQTEDKDEMP